MEIVISIFKLLAGIGLFLFAMYLIEDALKKLSGRKFKLFLQRITKSSLGAAAGGAVVTGILQSSSMVSLMVLAFVGAGVFTLKNAMAVILGANLGTTLDSWVVATLGFKTNIEIIAYPAVFIGGLLIIIFGKRTAIKDFSGFLFGFGLLFIGLSFMKTAMEAQVKGIDFAQFADMPMIVFLGIGFLITLLIQSSSVTMALTLSALHSGVIGFAPAAAIVLGSETGTTIKIMLSAIGGNASKKRAVLGNLLFNVFLTILAFSFLSSILYLISDILNIKDPLIALVTFSSLVNLLGLFVFLPLLDPFTKLLERFFKNTDASAAAFIGQANVEEPETALDLFRRETAYFIHNALLFNMEQFELNILSLENNEEFKIINEKRKFASKSPLEKYEFMKQLQGELQSFYMALRDKLQDKPNAQLSQLIASVRSTMYAVKGVKDISSNISNLSRSSKEIKFNFFIHQQKETEILYHQLNDFLNDKAVPGFKVFQTIYDGIQKNYTSTLNAFYKEAQQANLNDMDITTAINFNRELFTSNKAILIAVKDFLLDERQAGDFNEIPVYTT